MTEFAGTGSEVDPFIRFWSDIMAGMSGSSPSRGSMQEDMLRQMRQTFFDTWAKQCEDFMRSEAFLAMMKQSLDNALTFRERTSEFLQKTLNDAQMPSREDTESILTTVRALQEQVLDRLEALTRRVEALETSTGRLSTEGKPA